MEGGRHKGGGEGGGGARGRRRGVAEGGGGGERKAISCQQGMAVGHSNRPLPPPPPLPPPYPAPTTRLPCLLHSCQASKPAFKWRCGSSCSAPEPEF